MVTYEEWINAKLAAKGYISYVEDIKEWNHLWSSPFNQTMEEHGLSFSKRTGRWTITEEMGGNASVPDSTQGLMTIDGWIDQALAAKGYIRAQEDRHDFIIATGAGATKFNKWMKKAGLRWNQDRWTRMQETVQRRDNPRFSPPANPTTHLELLDYREIWDQLQTTPTMKATSEELGMSYNKIQSLNHKLNHYFEEGALDDWLRVAEELASIQAERAKHFGIPLGTRFDHRDDRLIMELRQVFVEYIRDPINHEPPSNEEIQWVYQQLLTEEENQQSKERRIEEPTPNLEEIIHAAGSRNFPRAQGAWGNFEQACAEITGCGWKMGMCKSSSGKDNAVNRMYTTGAIRSYPATLIHCLFTDDFLEEMTEVYRREFGSKLRSSPIMVLVQKRRPGSPWRATRVLVQDRHPLLPLNRRQIGVMFPHAEILRIDTTPFELTEGWGEEAIENEKLEYAQEDPSITEQIETMKKHHQMIRNRTAFEGQALDRKTEALRLSALGMTSSEVAERVTAHEVTVRRWLSAAGIKGKRGPKVKLRKREQAMDAFSKGKTPREIASELDIHPATVLRWVSNLEYDSIIHPDHREDVWLRNMTQNQNHYLFNSNSNTPNRKLLRYLMDHHYMDEKKASQFMKEARVSQGVGNIAQRFCTALLHHHHSVTSDLPDWCKATPTDVTLPPIDDAGVEGGAPDNLTGGQGPINLQNTMERILELQGEFSSLNTPEMQERGQLVRKEAPAIIRKWISKEKITDCEGRDGTGRKTRVPWFRVYLEEHSPSATKGWYLVYLFARDGSSVYLSLNQGTTKLVGKQFIPRDPTEIERRRSMALQRIKPLRHKWNGDMRIDLRDDKKLAKGYEAADVLHIRYRATIIPDDAELKEDLLRMMKYLQRLYDWKGQW